jgi:hypothetical protein
MARNNTIINSFVAGEISPKFLGRSETQQYQQACEDITNLITHVQGGASRRPGTQFIQDILQMDEATSISDGCLIPFLGTDGSAWVLCLTDECGDVPIGYVPGVDTDALPWKAVNIITQELSYIMLPFLAAATDGTETWLPGYYTLSALDVNPKQIQYAQSGDTIFLVHPRMRPLRIVYTSYPGVDIPHFRAYPFPDVTNAFADVAIFRHLPYLAKVIDPVAANAAIKLTCAITTGDLSISPGVTPPGITSIIVFDTTWHGRFIKFTRVGSTQCTVVMVTDVDSSTSAKVVQIAGTGPAYNTAVDYGGSDADYYYEMGAWDDEHGWPGVVAFFESRTYMAGTLTYSDKQWWSQINDYFQFDMNGIIEDSGYTDAAVASDPFTNELKEALISKIRWAITGKNITVGTNRREFIIRGPDSSSSLSFDNCASDEEMSHGSAFMQAVKYDNTFAFMHRSKRELREVSYNQDEDVLKATNLNIVAEHMAKKSYTAGYNSVWAPSPGYFTRVVVQGNIIWCLTTSGTLCGVTRDRTQQVASWHYHELAGDSFVTDGTDIAYKPEIIDIVSLPRPHLETDESDSEPDELWLLVARGVKGVATYTRKVYLEKLSMDWEAPNMVDGWETTIPQRAPVYMDCAYITDETIEDGNGESPGVVGSLPHGEGSVVTVLCNGFDFGEYTVDATGKIDISAKLGDTATWQVVVGFTFIGQLIPVVQDVPAQFGSSMGLIRRVDQITINFWRSLGCRFGRATDPNQENTPKYDLENVTFPRGDTVADPTPLFTGEKVVNFPLGYDRRPKIVVQSYRPFPMFVTHITTRQVINE